MANPSKAKGDQAERDALAYLLDICDGDPHLRLNPMRQLGAGRRDDIGDLAVLDDTVVQVKACNPRTLVRSVRSAAEGALAQQANALTPYAVGMTKFPGARTPTVRWIASTYQWPAELDPDAGVREFGTAVASALVYVRDDTSPAPRTHRVARISGRGLPPMFVAPFEAWLDARRAAQIPSTVP